MATDDFSSNYLRKAFVGTFKEGTLFPARRKIPRPHVPVQEQWLKLLCFKESVISLMLKDVGARGATSSQLLVSSWTDGIALMVRWLSRALASACHPAIFEATSPGRQRT